MDSFDDRIVGIEGEIGKIQRHQNIHVFDAELEEELREDEEENLPVDD